MPTKFTKQDADLLVQLAEKLYYALSDHGLDTNNQGLAEDVIEQNIETLNKSGNLYYDDGSG